MVSIECWLRWHGGGGGEINALTLCTPSFHYARIVTSTPTPVTLTLCSQRSGGLADNNRCVTYDNNGAPPEVADWPEILLIDQLY